ncbi:MAG: nuclear transport factor 2 family protein [Pseudomonadales bacterium]
MNNKLDQLLAKQEIYELSCRYMRGLDRLDQELLLDLFWEDGWCEYGFFDGTPSAFMEFAITALKAHAANQHMIGNVLIDIEGDEGFGEVYFQAYHKIPAGNGFEDMIISGRYLDRYECRDGLWKFAYRSERIDWSRIQPTQDSYFELAPDSLRGSRSDDAVYRRDNRRRP